MTLEDRPLADPLVVLREEFDDWAVLFHPDTGNAVGANPVGVAVWRNLDGRRTVREVAATLAGSFSDVPESAPDEVLALVNDLAEKGFVGLPQA